MAIWQLKAQIIPAAYIGERLQLDENEWEEMPWWSIHEPPENFACKFSTLLPPLKSWHEDLHQWGEQASDLIEIWYEEGKLESVSVQFDCRKLNYDFISSVINVANSIDCRLVYSRYKTVMPNAIQELLSFIKESPSQKVLLNPAEWLPKLAMEVADEQKNR
ncbi:MAG TPA: hypothetical protein DCS87_03150 [Rheinheimera sp.]|nr:hypothetical protein [Rheinheimera sp.]